MLDLEPKDMRYFSRTDRGCASIETVLDELFRDRAQVDDDLTGLDLVYLDPVD